jgi:L-asparaginase II
MEPIVVELRRKGLVEARHRVHAVAVCDGAVIAEAGDLDKSWFMRSASKPLQALPLVRARNDLDARDLAIVSASHRATRDQIVAVRALLAKAPATVDEFDLGVHEGGSWESISNSCSGTHAGMLALCRTNGWTTRGYRLPEHPVQEACRAAHIEAAEVNASDLQSATDGCGVVTFALPLERMAHAYARFPELPQGIRITDAMRAFPDLVGGPDGVDYLLMEATIGWFAKADTRGLLCAGGPGRTGVALKVEDGASRALPPALAAFLERFGLALPGLTETPIFSSHGGELTVARW